MFRKNISWGTWLSNCETLGFYRKVTRDNSNFFQVENDNLAIVYFHRIQCDVLIYVHMIEKFIKFIDQFISLTDTFCFGYYFLFSHKCQRGIRIWAAIKIWKRKKINCNSCLVKIELSSVIQQAILRANPAKMERIKFWVDQKIAGGLRS